MHAIGKLANSPTRGEPQVAVATVEAIPTIPIDRAEDGVSDPRLLSATGSSHPLQFYTILVGGCV